MSSIVLLDIMKTLKQISHWPLIHHQVRAVGYCLALAHFPKLKN